MAKAIVEAFLDFRHALRLLRKAPVFAGVATLSLGLGIGANVGIFSLANAVLLEALPVDKPERLVRIQPGDTAPGWLLHEPDLGRDPRS